MSVILILILISLTLALVFLACFIWAVRSGQFEDTATPSMRILTDELKTVGGPPRSAAVSAAAASLRSEPSNALGLRPPLPCPAAQTPALRPN